MTIKRKKSPKRNLCIQILSGAAELWDILHPVGFCRCSIGLFGEPCRQTRSPASAQPSCMSRREAL